MMFTGKWISLSFSWVSPCDSFTWKMSPACDHRNSPFSDSHLSVSSVPFVSANQTDFVSVWPMTTKFPNHCMFQEFGFRNRSISSPSFFSFGFVYELRLIESVCPPLYFLDCYLPWRIMIMNRWGNPNSPSLPKATPFGQVTQLHCGSRPLSRKIDGQCREATWLEAMSACVWVHELTLSWLSLLSAWLFLFWKMKAEECPAKWPCFQGPQRAKRSPPCNLMMPICMDHASASESVWGKDRIKDKETPFTWLISFFLFLSFFLLSLSHKLDHDFHSLSKTHADDGPNLPHSFSLSEREKVGNWRGKVATKIVHKEMLYH